MTEATWDRPAQALGLFLRGHTLRTAAPTALVVGTILCAVNQGQTLIAGQATTGTWLRMAFNYAVPRGCQHRIPRRPTYPAPR